MPARIRINLFSPLPPLHSEVGNHTITVAAALHELADVTLWTPQQDQPEIGLDLPVIRYDPGAVEWRRLNQADATIYNIGNNATFHRAIFDVARLAPGIVVLHDTRLQHFFAGYADQPGPHRDFYLECLRRSHGPAAMEAAQRWLAGEAALDALVEHYPMTLAASDPALAVVVHNEVEQRSLAAQTRTPVFHLPLAFAAGPAPDRSKSARGGSDGTIRLIVFGFLGPNRRLQTVLDVMASLEDQDIRLDIYGVLDDPDPVEGQIARLGLTGRAVCHGFVPAAVLQAALSTADLAINLRLPSMGEASASQLRIWDAALPSLVTRTGWYATLPGDTVFFVEPEREAETLRAQLAALRRDDTLLRAAGLRGRALLEQHHTPAGYARGLLRIVEQADRLHARRQAIELSRRAARAMLEWSDAGAALSCIDPVAAAIAALAAGR